MTDVEAKTPTKKRVLDKADKKGSAKKAKVTPEKQKKAANRQNNVQNINQKLKTEIKNIKSENGSPKKLKPFTGTSEITASNEKERKGSKKVTKANKGKGEQKKPRKSYGSSLKDKLNSKDKDTVLKTLEEKIQTIQSRGELSKTAKRKLKLLQRLKRFTEGKTDDQAKQQASTGNKSSTKKKQTVVTKGQQPNTVKKVVKNQTKMEVVKLNDKKAKLQNKQTAKKVQQGPKVQVKEEAESSDDEDELESDVEEEEDDDENEGTSEEESGEEEEGDSDGDEEEDGESEENGDSDEDDDSDEDESEDDTPPQVSTKKQKKK